MIIYMKNYKYLVAMVSLIIILSGCSQRNSEDIPNNSTTPTTNPSPTVEVTATPQPTPEATDTITQPEVPLIVTPPAPDLSVDMENIIGLDSSSVPWGPGVHYNEAGVPSACVTLQEQYGEYDAYFIGEYNENIYLTFDEGYENGHTPHILDTLQEKGVSAVFFVTMGYAKSQPELIQRIIDEGHVLANHSTAHPNFTTITPEEIVADVAELHNYILEEFGYTMHLFRYPEGAFSEQTLAILQDMGYYTMFWSFAYADWDVNNQPDQQEAYNKIVDNLHKGEIILLHAVSEINALVLGDVIDYAREEGYRLANGYEIIN